MAEPRWTPDDWGRLDTAAAMFIGVGEGPKYRVIAERVNAQVSAGYLTLVHVGPPHLYRATNAGKAALAAYKQATALR